VEGLLERIAAALEGMAERIGDATIEGFRVVIGEAWEVTLTWMLVYLPQIILKGFLMLLSAVAGYVMGAVGETGVAQAGHWLVGTPADITYGLPVVQDLKNVCVVVALAMAVPAGMWSAQFYTLGLSDGGAGDLAKRIVGGLAMVGLINPLLDLGIQVTDAVALTFTGGAAQPPGWATMADKTVGLDAIETVQTIQAETLMGGAAVFPYVMAVVVGGIAAVLRIAAIDCFYVLAPLAMVGLIAPVGSIITKAWGAAIGAAILVILPAAVLLRFASDLLTRWAVGDGTVWTAIIGVAVMGFYAALMGKGALGGGFSLVTTTVKVVRTVRRF
jgi:hypothetical protein